jgi:hypothetical protein
MDTAKCPNALYIRLDNNFNYFNFSISIKSILIVKVDSVNLNQTILNAVSLQVVKIDQHFLPKYSFKAVYRRLLKFLDLLDFFI